MENFFTAPAKERMLSKTKVLHSSILEKFESYTQPL